MKQSVYKCKYNFSEIFVQFVFCTFSLFLDPVSTMPFRQLMQPRVIKLVEVSYTPSMIKYLES